MFPWAEHEHPIPITWPLVLHEVRSCHFEAVAPNPDEGDMLLTQHVAAMCRAHARHPRDSCWRSTCFKPRDIADAADASTRADARRPRPRDTRHADAPAGPRASGGPRVLAARMAPRATQGLAILPRVALSSYPGRAGRSRATSRRSAPREGAWRMRANRARDARSIVVPRVARQQEWADGCCTYLSACMCCCAPCDCVLALGVQRRRGTRLAQRAGTAQAPRHTRETACVLPLSSRRHGPAGAQLEVA